MLGLIAAIAVAAPSPTGAATPIDPDQKIRCQRQEVTGSLIGLKKVCHTVAEWRRMAEAARNDAERTVEAGRTCPACQGQ